jgi:hypothetical protein
MVNEEEDQKEKNSGLGNLFKNYDPRVIKDRWNRVRADPYAALKFQYQVTKWIVIGLILFIVVQLGIVIYKYDGRSSAMTMIVRAVMLFVMVMVTIKAWGTLTPLKNALKQYEQVPVSEKNTFKEINVEKEVDDILSQFDDKGRRIKQKRKKV